MEVNAEVSTADPWDGRPSREAAFIEKLIGEDLEEAEDKDRRRQALKGRAR
jgi:hypothetical protein